MGTYKGNKGNLMQHWTLCEVLSIANRYHSALNYIDAHAMAPLAKKRTGDDVVFDRVWDRLANGNSTYEKAWSALAPRPADSYPSSAKFVQHVWLRRFLAAAVRNRPQHFGRDRVMAKWSSQTASVQGSYAIPGRLAV